MERLEPVTAIDIMHKLWELNMLTNNHIQSEPAAFSCQKPYIRFIYAISESIFTSEERTKYFDCIIPIIPALNPLNTRETIISLFIPEVVCESEYINSVVENLAPLLTDYRMLLDARNEYLVYRKLYCKCKSSGNTQYKLKEHEEATLLAVVAYKVLFPQKFEHALSAGGPGMLSKITSDDLDQYYGDKTRYSAVYRTKLENGINKLFEKSILDTTCLRMVGVADAWLLEHWIAMVLSAIGHSPTAELAINLDALINELERSSTSNELINNFKKEVAHIANSCEDADKYILLARCLAAVSRDNAADWNWFWGDASETNSKRKQHFTLCFKYLSSVQPIPPLLDSFLGKDSLSWFISNLSIMELNDMNGCLHWNNRMGNILACYLCGYENFPNQDTPSHLTELVVADNRSLGRFIADNR